MSKPESIKIDPWTDFSKQNYRIFEDDFVHDKLFVAKFNANGSRSTINIKQTLSLQDGNFSVADDVKFWFSLPQQNSLYCRIKAKALKVHFDGGVRQWNNIKWNPYGSFSSNKSFQNLVMKLGIHHISEHCNSDNRFKIEFGTNTSYRLYSRTEVKHNNCGIGLLAVYNLTNNVIEKNSLLFKYNHQKKHEFWIRLLSNKWRSKNPENFGFTSLFPTSTIDYVAKINDTTRVGLQASINLANMREPLQNLQVVTEKQFPASKTTLKVRMNKDLNLAFAVKTPVKGFNDIATITAGGNFGNWGKKLKINYGAQLDLNV